jgi:hypothetical protein
VAPGGGRGCGQPGRGRRRRRAAAAVAQKLNGACVNEGPLSGTRWWAWVWTAWPWPPPPPRCCCCRSETQWCACVNEGPLSQRLSFPSRDSCLRGCAGRSHGQGSCLDIYHPASTRPASPHKHTHSKTPSGDVLSLARSLSHSTSHRLSLGSRASTLKKRHCAPPPPPQQPARSRRRWCWCWWAPACEFQAPFSNSC